MFFEIYEKTKMIKIFYFILHVSATSMSVAETPTFKLTKLPAILYEKFLKTVFIMNILKLNGRK